MNNRFSRTVTALILTFAIAVAPVLPLSAYAADAPALETAITTLGLSASVNGSTVTVTGSVKNPAEPLILNIDSDVTVVWRANLTGAPVNNKLYFILLEGDGNFEVKSGAISAQGCEAAINNVGNVDIIISGGLVEATGTGTYACYAIKSDYSSGKITVSGGTVKVEGSAGSAAIYVGGGGVEVSGGEVIAVGATPNYAFYADSGSVDVTGGLVFGYGNSTNDIANSNVSLDNTGGTVLVWDNNETGPFTAGDTTGLDVDPSGSAAWGRQNGVGGIIYDTDKFLPISGVTVKAAPTAPQSFTAIPGDGQVTLSWEAPKDNGGDLITKYKVSKDDGVNWEDASSNTGHTFTGLTNGTLYTFKVRAVNGIGEGEEASATATPIEAPIPVTSIAVTGAGGATTITTNGGALQMLAEVQPANATNRAVTWTISGGSGAAVNPTTGLLTATANGTVTVRATADDGSGVFGETAITISGQSGGVIPVTSIAVTGAGGATTITAYGGTLQMLADVQPANATNRAVTWTISGGSGAAVNEATGLLTATANGTVTVRATAEDGSGVFGQAEITISGQSGGSSVNSSNNGDSGNSGGKDSVTIGVPISPMWLERIPAATLASEAKRENRNFVRTGYGYQYGVRGNAWDRLVNLQYQHDTMDGKSVQVRLYVNEPERFTKDTLVSGWVKGAEVDKVRGIFEKWFSNKVRVIHFDQQADWEQPVGVAARVDLAGMNTENLYFYSYDKKANSYRRIEKPAYWIDKNGYLHFDTPYAGDIVISENPLEKK